MMSEHTYPDWWPDGCDEDLVRECNCEQCELMVDALEDWRAGIAPDGEHATLDSFAET